MSNIREKLTNELLYLYNTGKLHHAYRTFGAHIADGGVQFTLWAPDVRSVRVTGDFNGWDASAVMEQFDRAFVACVSDCANVQHTGNVCHMRVHASVVSKVVERLQRIQNAYALLILDGLGFNLIEGVACQNAVEFEGYSTI